ncbi:hypothetical protein HD806DRAFT_512035 [Xylariaceae sp. AK1471]|nr:hypothetical protein HD806DRAFT_512035 [Xylariaceae sp. AK1471]
MTNSTATPQQDAEKTTNALTFAEPPAASSHHPHLAQARERLRHFFHPDGRKIHIAHSPEEALSLRQQLSSRQSQIALNNQTNIGPDNVPFDIYLSGSKEHLDALRSAQAHHRLQKEELRSQDPTSFARFENVHVELDALGRELDRVTTQGVFLEAHFNKYGYNAKIRSYDEGETPMGAMTPRSSATGPTGSQSSGNDGASVRSSKAERGFDTPLKLWKRPVVRQYWHKGILWRASGSQEVQSFELFVDLLYVGILAIIGDAASEEPTGHALLQFVITFLLSWKIWTDLELTISWFETDDVLQRISILFQLAVLFGLTTNITRAFEGTYATLIGFYLTARLLVAGYFFLIALLVPMIRPIMFWLVAMMLISSAIWITSIHVLYPLQLVPIFIGLWFDMFYQALWATANVFGRRLSSRFGDWFERNVEIAPGINIEHRTERINAFVTLVFGYMVVSILYQSTRNGIDAHFGKAVLGLTQAFCFNWLYFEIDASNLEVHAIRRSAQSTLVWTLSHVLFIMSFTLAGGALARLVLATDTASSDIDALTEAYQEKSEPDIADGIRWFYCAGLGIALASMGLISISHTHRLAEGLRLPKRYRLIGRFVVAIIFVLLPLAKDLNSLQVIGLVTALVVFVLGLELWAASCCNESLCSRDKPCQYTGRCGKKDLARLVQEGHEKVDIESLLRRDEQPGLGLT